MLMDREAPSDARGRRLARANERIREMAQKSLSDIEYVALFNDTPPPPPSDLARDPTSAQGTDLKVNSLGRFRVPKTARICEPSVSSTTLVS